MLGKSHKACSREEKYDFTPCLLVEEESHKKILRFKENKKKSHDREKSECLP